MDDEPHIGGNLVEELLNYLKKSGMQGDDDWEPVSEKNRVTLPYNFHWDHFSERIRNGYHVLQDGVAKQRKRQINSIVSKRLIIND